jgi:alanyl-tRNA synthetase
LKLLDDELKTLGKEDLLKGDVAFKLYDTYGFPLDLTQDILKAKEIKVDIDGFNSCMEEQKKRARAAWAGSGEQATAEIWFDLYQKFGATEFLGYKNNQAEAVVLAVINEKDRQIIITNQTPFYGESGGQMGDIGTINNTKIVDTKKFLGKIHAHYVENGNFKDGDKVLLQVDENYRNNLRIHHSATHLLHNALREALGTHLTQKGSLVAFDRLRFDFSHNKALSLEEITKVEDMVNKMIRDNNEACTQLMSTEEAIKAGAMALFGEKYDDEVRVVSMGPSTELCGGTHVKRTGDIGIIKIISESAIAAGVRRIEAVCGEFACKYLNAQDQKLSDLASILKTPKAEVIDKISSLIKDKKNLEDELSDAKKKLLLLDPNIKTSKIGEVTLIEKFAEGIDAKDLRNFVDYMRNSNDNSLIVAGSSLNGKTSLIIGIHQNLIDKYDAAELTRKANEIAGGQGGGGRKELAQAGGFDFAKIDAVSLFIKSSL